MPGIAIPLRPEKVEEWRAWTRELNTTRRAEFDDFNRRMRLTAHRAWLLRAADGPMVVVVHDGPGADEFLVALSASDHPFDRWFRERISEYHGLDFSRPPEGAAPETAIDWRG